MTRPYDRPPTERDDEKCCGTADLAVDSRCRRVRPGARRPQLQPSSGTTAVARRARRPAPPAASRATSRDDRQVRPHRLPRLHRVQHHRQRDGQPRVDAVVQHLQHVPVAQAPPPRVRQHRRPGRRRRRRSGRPTARGRRRRTGRGPRAAAAARRARCAPARRRPAARAARAPTSSARATPRRACAAGRPRRRGGRAPSAPSARRRPGPRRCVSTSRDWISSPHRQKDSLNASRFCFANAMSAPGSPVRVGLHRVGVLERRDALGDVEA